MTVPCLVLRNQAGNKFFFFTVHMYPCERKIRSPNGSFAPQKRAAHTCIIFLRSKTASVLLLNDYILPYYRLLTQDFQQAFPKFRDF